jgi:hypothetical protein
VINNVYLDVKLDNCLGFGCSQIMDISNGNVRFCKILQG